MDEILIAFNEEAVDLLEAMETGLIRMEEGECDPDIINSVFRAAHTIKGDAGIVNLVEVQTFAHTLEDTLSLLRGGKIDITPPLISLLLNGCDHIKALIAAAANGPEVLDERLQAAGTALVNALQQSAQLAEIKPGADIQLAEALPDESLNPDEISLQSTAASTTQAPLAAQKAMESRQIRVPAEKLDQLIDLVGQLVISSAAAQLKAKQSGQADLAEANSGLVKLVESMRELSTQLRMVRVGDVFNRFKRAARDMAQAMNLEIDLVIHGEETELDKSVVEKIGDPLMHLLRNALDHGIEAADVRRACGKSARGTIELNAYYETGGIVIEVSDDGAGLDKDRILAKAIERGLVDAGQSLSDQEIIDLIFMPGFSTTDTVSSISGRGVGMDVVRSNINALRGTVEVQSELGRGTKFIFRLPLTMAIIDGFGVGIGVASYVIPRAMIVECLELREDSPDQNCLNLRGTVLPLLRLRERFAERSARPARENVVVVNAGMGCVGIVVDFLYGELQTVIKPLSSIFRNLPGIAGSTILGTGTVALILDVPALITQAEAGKRRH